MRKSILGFTAILGVLALLHATVQYKGLSLISFPLTAALFLSTAGAGITVVVIGGILLELASSAPAGTLLLAVAMPEIIQLIFGRVHPDFSLRYLRWVVSVSVLQIIMLFSFSAIVHGLQGIPWPGILLMAVATIGISFLTSALWGEYE